MVMIDGRLIGYRYGGIANYALQLANHACRFSRGLDIRLALRRSVPELSDRSVRAFTPPHHRLERQLFGLEVTYHRPNVLHSVDYVQPVARSVRHIVTVHDLAFFDNPNLVTRESLEYYGQIRETLPQADLVIAVSEWTRERILHHIEVDPDRVVTIPNGYDHTIFGPNENADMHRLGRLNLELIRARDKERPIVVAVGTLEPRKRYEILFEAFGESFDEIERHAGVTPLLVVVGQNGWLTDDLVIQLRALIHRGRAVWLRQTSDRDLAAIYRSATLLAQSSADEGFGLPVLEAMACGVPALVSGKGALPSLVGDCGFIETKDDPHSWAGTIGRILGDHEIRSIRARRSLERAAPMTWAETARRTAEIYRRVLDE